MSASETFKWILDLDNKGAVKGFEQIGRTADTELGKAESRIDKLGAGLTKFGAGAMAFAGVAGAGLIKLGSDASAAAIEAGKFSDATGLSVEAASRWIEVAGDMGIEAGTVEKSIGFMNKTLGAAPEKFAALGVEIVKAKDGTTDVNATFLATVDRLNAIKDPQERATEGAKLLGRGWQEMAELVRTGSGQLKASLDQVSDAKITTPEELAKAKDFRAAIDQMRDAFQDLAINIGQGAMPVIATFAKGIGTVADGFGKLNAITSGGAGTFLAIGTAVIGAAGALSFITGKVITGRDRFQKLFTTIGDDGERSMSKFGKATAVATGVVAAAGIVYGLYASDKAEAEAITREFTDALKAEAEGQEGALDALIAKRVAESGALEIAKKFGLTATDLAKVIKGEQVPAWDAATKSLGAIGSETNNLVIAMGPLINGMNDARQQAADFAEIQKELGKETGATTKGVDTAARQWIGYGKALGEAQEAADANRAAVEDLREQLEIQETHLDRNEQAEQDLADAEDKHKQVIDDLADAIEAHNEKVQDRIDLEQKLYEDEQSRLDAKYAFEQQLRDLAEAQGEYNVLLGDSKTTAKEAEDATFAMAEKYRDAAKAFAESKGAADGSRASIDLQVESLLGVFNTLADGSPLRSVVLRYIADLQRIPTNVETKLTVTAGSRPGRVVEEHHDGGVVGGDGPIGSEQLILAKKGETVLPTHKSGGASTVDIVPSSPGVVINLHVAEFGMIRAVVAEEDRAKAMKLQAGRHG